MSEGASFIAMPMAPVFQILAVGVVPLPVEPPLRVVPPLTRSIPASTDQCLRLDGEEKNELFSERLSIIMYVINDKYANPIDKIQDIIY